MNKKYVLYPGVGRLGPFDDKEQYICGKELALCYRVPYSECQDTSLDPIRKVMRLGAKFDQLIALVPREDGNYRLPTKGENKIIVAHGIMDMVKK